ncbi:MAG: hypothetical protein HRT61_10265 [Ekhidna sp.]|nr:hypothetical protein [Ekhidna sp.]
MDVETAIKLTVSRMRTTEFSRHDNDCDAIMADYVIMLTGLDPMAAWRGKYFNDEGAEAFIKEAGGNCSLVRAGMNSIGISSHLGEPKRGDVVVIDYHGEEITGLYLYPFTALKTERGARQARFAKIIGAWTCV